MADTRSDLIAENNRVFRSANESIRSKSREYHDPLERIPFICECAQADCTTIVRLTPAEYEAVRSNPMHFFTIDGHEHAEEPLGQVVSREGEYVIVEKDVSD